MTASASYAMALSDDMRSVFSRFSELLWEGVAYDHTFGDSAAVDFYTTLIPGDLPDTMCWADINYADRERSGWDASKHYSRIQNLLTQHGRARLCEDATYRDAMVAALRYWLLHASLRYSCTCLSNSFF